MKAKTLLLFTAVAAATAALWPAAGSAATRGGIVVGKQRGTLLVAAPSGLVQGVRGKASLGSRIVVTGGKLRVVGHARRAKIRGIVVRTIGTTTILSSNRNLVAVPNRAGRRLADTTPAPTTAPGTLVETTVSIQNGQIEEEDEQEVGKVQAQQLTVQATVKAVAAGSVTLDVQGQVLTMSLPAGLTLPASLVGQTVSIAVRLADDDDELADDDHGDHEDDHGDDEDEDDD